MLRIICKFLEIRVGPSAQGGGSAAQEHDLPAAQRHAGAQPTLSSPSSAVLHSRPIIFLGREDRSSTDLATMQEKIFPFHDNLFIPLNLYGLFNEQVYNCRRQLFIARRSFNIASIHKSW
jgi:hypothetical protein